jgi:hypothetical protein
VPYLWAWGFKSPLRHKVSGLRRVTTRRISVKAVSPIGPLTTPIQGGHVCLRIAFG